MRVKRGLAFATLVLMFLTVGACGAPTDDVEVSEHEASEDVVDLMETVPADLSIGTLSVSNNYGWIFGSRDPDSASAGLWRLDSESVGKVVDLAGTERFSFKSTDLGVDGVVLRCEKDGDECVGWRADVLQFDNDGNLRGEFTVLEVDRPMERSDGAVMLGRADGEVWVRVHGHLVGITDDDGHLLGPFRTTQGDICIIDDQIYAVRTPDPAASPESSSDSSTSTHSTYEVVRLESTGEWVSVDEGRHSFEAKPPQSLTANCSPDGIHIEVSGGHLLAGTWTPEIGWVETLDRSTEAVANLNPSGVADATSYGRFLHLADGRILERQNLGTYEDTGIELPALRVIEAAPEGFESSDLDPPMASLVADSSDHLFVACISGFAEGRHLTVCDAVQRG